MVVSSHEDTGRAINPIWFQAVVEQINREAGKRRQLHGQDQLPGPARSPCPGRRPAAPRHRSSSYLVRIAAFSSVCTVQVAQGALQWPCRHQNPMVLACRLKAARAEQGLALPHHSCSSCDEGAASASTPSTAASLVPAFFAASHLPLCRGNWRAGPHAAQHKQGAKCHLLGL